MKENQLGITRISYLALGRTVTELEGSKPALLVDKLQFSMMVPAVNTFLNEQNPKIESAVLFGIESHVCVLQTALDALALGLNVHILADGVSSSQQTEIPIALEVRFYEQILHRLIYFVANERSWLCRNNE